MNFLNKMYVIHEDLTVFTVQIKTRSPNPKIGHSEFSYIFNSLNMCCHKFLLVCTHHTHSRTHAHTHTHTHTQTRTHTRTHANLSYKTELN